MPKDQRLTPGVRQFVIPRLGGISRHLRDGREILRCAQNDEVLAAPLVIGSWSLIGHWGLAIDAVCRFLCSLERGPLVRWSCHTHLTEEATMTFEDYLLHLFYLVDSELEALKSE